MRSYSALASLGFAAITAALSTTTTYSLASFDPKNLSVLGCYSILNDELNNWHMWEENSAQICAKNCIKYYNSTAIALNGYSCFCGHTIPPKDKLVEDKLCKIKCHSQVDESDAAIPCGGRDYVDRLHGIPKEQQYYTVLKTGLEADVPEGHLTVYDQYGDLIPDSSQASSVPTSTTAVTGIGPTASNTPVSGSATPIGSSTSHDTSGAPSAPVPTGSAPLVAAHAGMLALFGLAAHFMVL